ncbi:hypothetical protein ACFQV8_04275 [Pseudonocardia benzenivorans]
MSDPKAAYERLRGAHLAAVRAALEDHVARADWPWNASSATGPSGCAPCSPSPASVRRSTRHG